jgi:folate-binding protein YgfZ
MNEGASVIETPLAALHRAAGARMGEWFGCALPDDFGDVATEERLAMESVALLDKNYRAYLAFTGPDRVRYLNAILTNNVKDLEAGAGSVSLLLNPQGRILAEIETYAFEDRLFCVSYAMIRQRLIEWLDKYIIMDDVTLTDETERFGTLALEGPKAVEVVKKLTGLELAALGELSLTETKVDRIGCRLGKRSPGGVPGAEFLAERGDLQKLWGALEAAVRREGGGPMGYQALSARRLEQGIPWFGYDFGEQQIPHEAGLEKSHISYTKGCYTGQEIVERVRSRGQVNRVRVLLKFAGPELAAAGEPLLADGKESGRVTRSAFSHALGAVIGMGYVRRENGAADSILQWSGGAATVVRPPISA